MKKGVKIGQKFSLAVVFTRNDTIEHNSHCSDAIYVQISGQKIAFQLKKLRKWIVGSFAFITYVEFGQQLEYADYNA